LVKATHIEAPYSAIVRMCGGNAMALKDLLVHVDDSKACKARVEAAIGIAREHEAHLTGLYVIPTVDIPSYAEAQIPVEVIETQRKAARVQAAQAEKSFNGDTQRASILAEWRCVEDDVARTLTVHARYVDLVVTGQADRNDPMSHSGLTEKVVLEAGRPVLAIPYIGAPKTFGQHVLIAWNARREAVRALQDSLPLLARAKRNGTFGQSAGWAGR
jgi:nucleotide-binding universal stress UspA family protein